MAYKYGVHIAVCLILISICSSVWAKSHEFPSSISRLSDIPITVNQTSGCGGVIEAYRGFISYKFKENYDNNERCVWTIKSTKATILFALMEDGFETSYDFLTIYNLDASGSLVNNGRMKHGFYQEFGKSKTSTAFLTFTSDRSTTGTGFLLEFIGFGPTAVVGALGYTNLISNVERGTLAYPKGRSFQQSGYAFVSFLISPNTSTGNEVSLTVDSVDMPSLYHGCQNNYLSVHELFVDSFDVRLRYCESERFQTSTVKASSPILVTFFGFLNTRRDGFKISWESHSSGKF